MSQTHALPLFRNPESLPWDLLLARKALRVLGRGHSVARALLRQRLETIGIVRLASSFGFDILVDPSDYLGWAIFMHATHEPEVTSLVLEQMSNGGLFVDVGANHGWFSLLAATKVRSSGGRVWAFEPQARLSGLLRHSSTLNGLSNLTVVQAAVGRKKGRGRIEQRRARHSGFVSVSATADSVGDIDVTCLDGVLEGQVPVAVKIDVEGNELAVLEGMSSLLADTRLRCLIIEVHPALMTALGDDPGDLLALLENAGFTVQLLGVTARGTRRPTLSPIPQSFRQISCFNIVAQRRR